MNSKITLIIPVEKDWDETSEEVIYMNDLDKVLDSPESLETELPLNRIVCPDINRLNFKLLDMFKDIVVRESSGYLSLRELYDDMADGGGYTDRCIQEEHDLVKIFRASGFKMKRISEYIYKNGGVKAIISETFPDRSQISEIMEQYNLHMESTLKMDCIDVSGHAITLKIHSDSTEVIFDTVVDDKHLAYVSLKELLARLVIMLKVELYNK